MKRIDFLKMVQLDNLRYGHTLDSTLALKGDTKVSGSSISNAGYFGRRQREEIQKKYGIWEKKHKEDTIRGKLARALSCGDLLTETKNQELIRELAFTRHTYEQAVQNANFEIDRAKPEDAPL